MPAAAGRALWVLKPAAAVRQHSSTQFKQLAQPSGTAHRPTAWPPQCRQDEATPPPHTHTPPRARPTSSCRAYSASSRCPCSGSGARRCSAGTGRSRRPSREDSGLGACAASTCRAQYCGRGELAGAVMNRKGLAQVCVPITKASLSCIATQRASASAGTASPRHAPARAPTFASQGTGSSSTARCRAACSSGQPGLLASPLR